jgi:hypothetical protein
VKWPAMSAGVFGDVIQLLSHCRGYQRNPCRA